jgi:catechol 2,3-dioxygenase-like lactoylglutathione lyase family enzyme
VQFLGKIDMIIGIDHIELIVRDVKEFVAFYEKMGFKLLSWTEHHGGSAEMQMPGMDIIFEIHTLTGEENPGINHISFRCDDVSTTHADLTAKGITFSKPVHESPSTGRKNVLLRDPDGWRLQLSDARRFEHARKAG